MLVYGDHQDVRSPLEVLAEVAATLDRVRTMPSGIERHAALTRAFVESGRVLQGLADADFEEIDRRSTQTDTIGEFLHELASTLIASWAGDRSELSVPAVPMPIGLPDTIELRVPEGYAFYALYPEAFAEAAGALRLTAPPFVIGIRSIGTSLGAIVAAALNAAPAISVRPFGDPFDRRIALSPELEAELLGEPRHFVIVDEGPGLSGSSFGSVVDWLEFRGVPRDRIAFVCSHGGTLGPEALQRHRARWSEVQRAVGDFGPKFPELVKDWYEELIGAPARVTEISGGGWRPLQSPNEAGWPAMNPSWERRKFLLRTETGEWIARFAGLGSEGERKLAIARKLHEAGFAPKPPTLAHGFLVEQWEADGVPLSATEKPLDELSSYIAARRNMPVPRPGASVADLYRMAKRNAELALGPEAAQQIERWLPHLEQLQMRVLSVCTDNRLDRHEWLRLPDGRLLKTDAVDHHAGHDLIGCQDMAWDVAAAAVEFGLTDGETRALARTDPDLLNFMIDAYLAFRLGQASLSARMTSGADNKRWRKMVERYAQLLNARLRIESDEPTREKSLIVEEPERTGGGTNLCSSG